MGLIKTQSRIAQKNKMTTTVSDFNPSNVVPSFINSFFQNTQKECLAAHIVTFLQKNGNDWNDEIEVGMFFEHTRNQQFEVLIYNDPLANPFLRDGFIQAMHHMVNEGYVEWTEELKKFKITTKLIEFYCGYSK